MPTAGLLQIFAKKATQTQERLMTQVKGLREQFPENACPTEETLLRIINKRNSLAAGVNQLQDQIRSIGAVGTTITNILRPIPPAISIIKLLPIPTLTPGLTAGTITTASDILNTLKDLVSKFSSIAGGFTFLIEFITNITNQINAQFTALDSLIEGCAQELGIEYEIINNELNSLSDEELQEGFGVYKGFTFEIKYSKLNETPYPKRYAIARNSAGIITLTSDESFASDPTVLVNELKFLIDTQDLKG